MKEFKCKEHDLLNEHDPDFDRDYAHFMKSILSLEKKVQRYINDCFNNINSLEKKLTLLQNFENIIERDSMKNDLKQKYTTLYNS